MTIVMETRLMSSFQMGTNAPPRNPFRHSSGVYHLLTASFHLLHSGIAFQSLVYSFQLTENHTQERLSVSFAGVPNDLMVTAAASECGVCDGGCAQCQTPTPARRHREASGTSNTLPWIN